MSRHSSIVPHPNPAPASTGNTRPHVLLTPPLCASMPVMPIHLWVYVMLFLIVPQQLGLSLMPCCAVAPMMPLRPMAYVKSLSLRALAIPYCQSPQIPLQQ